MPIKNGGSNSIDNLVLICKTCHRYVHHGDIEKLIERALTNNEYY